MVENWIKTFSGLRKRVESNSFLDKVFSSDLTPFIDWPASSYIVTSVESVAPVQEVVVEPTKSSEVVFLSDYVREKNNLETEALIKKIAEAMKLTENEYQFIYFIEEKFDKKIDIATLMEQKFSQLENRLVGLSPKVIITLG